MKMLVRFELNNNNLNYQLSDAASPLNDYCRMAAIIPPILREEHKRGSSRLEVKIHAAIRPFIRAI